MDKEIYCEIGDCNEPGEGAHIITRATIPRALWDCPSLMMNLCRHHHSEQHSIGIETFCLKYGLTDRLQKARGSIK